MRATTRAVSVDLFMKSPAQSDRLYAADCANTVESATELGIFHRRGAHITLEFQAPGVLSASHGVAPDQAGRGRGRPCAYEESAGGAAQTAPPGSALAALGLHPQHAAAIRRAAGRRLALLGGARRHPLPPGAGRL